MAITLSDLESFRRQVEATRKQLQEEEIALKVLERLLNSTDQRHDRSALLQSANGVDLFSDDDTSAPDSKMMYSDALKRKSSLKDSVLAICKIFGEGTEFTVADIEEELARRGQKVNGQAPRARIAMALQKLRSEGLVRKTYEGTGSIPHRFTLMNIFM